MSGDETSADATEPDAGTEQVAESVRTRYLLSALGRAGFTNPHGDLQALNFFAAHDDTVPITTLVRWMAEEMGVAESDADHERG